MQVLLSLTHEEARRAIDAIAGELERRKKAAVSAVADSHGELLAFLRLDGAPVSSINIAINKAFTAARERTKTSALGEQSRHPETGFPMTNFGDLRHINWGGGVPVVVDGQVAGAVAVSGLSEKEDEEVANIGVSAMTTAG